MNTRIRNEQAIMAWREAGTGTGIDFIDKSIYGAEALNASSLIAYHQKNSMGPTEHLSWDLLFNDADLCECGHCTSVYSPAAYFVELLQYLGNNNLDPANPNTGQSGYKNTPLEILFQRRPDLGCLELTCENTNTVLPYVDLVNEVMENYVVFQKTKAFNVDDETSTELLAQPQHTEYEAYCILHKAVYPFTLPYHQPIDATRIFLEFLKTSRYELQDTFRSARKIKNEPNADNELCDPESLPEAAENQSDILDALYENYLQRAIGAEYLKITQEEYVILTKEAFVSKKYWDTQCNQEHTLEEYQKKIGLKPVHEYYGYASEADMLSLDEGKQLGLTFVKKQFLPRTGVAYTDLVELLKTQFLNPNMPQGEARAIMEEIQFSYRYLQSLVNEGANSPKGKYENLIKFLKNPSDFLPEFRRRIDSDSDPCNPKQPDECVDNKAIEQWVYCYFEQIGKIIVLENNNCDCVNGVIEISGILFMRLEVQDCDIYKITDENADGITGQIKIGHIEKNTGKVTIGEGSEINFENVKFISDDGALGIFINGYLVDARTRLPFCKSSADNCDLETVRLVHLDGSPLTVEEYDCFHRFIRLWRKLDWTIDETDKAIIGLGKTSEDCLDDQFPNADDCETDCGDLFEEGEPCGEGEDAGDCFHKKRKIIKCDITPELIHQLVAVQKLLHKTGLELIKLLTFWTDISTIGKKSLYQRLFLKHNVRALDPVFKADKNGLYLIGNAKISAHLPVLMAVLKLKADNLNAIDQAANLEDKLNLHTVSLLYRYRLLSRVIGEKIPAFLEVLELFGDVFQDAHSTLAFLDKWMLMEEAGFTFRQLNYTLRDKDDLKRPLKPNQKTILQLAKTLYDGLNAIEEAHKDLGVEEEATVEMVRTKTALLFTVAVSTAQNDSGLFELNFRDDRYLPFECAGAISKWRVELPSEIRQFDYQTINDVIIHVRYTAKEGGERLKIAASETVRDYFKSVEELGQEEGHFAIIDLKHDLPTEWHKAINIAPEAGIPRTFDLSKIGAFLPYFAKFKNGQMRAEKDILVSDIQLVIEGDLKPEEIELRQAEAPFSFTKGIEIGAAQSFLIRDEALKLNDWQLSINKEEVLMESGFLLLRLVFP